MKKQIGFKTKGMNRDLSVSAFNPEFAFENRNLRLATNEGNTLMSWVNEKGTQKITISAMSTQDGSSDKIINGTPLGTAIIDHKLVIFTHDTNTSNAKPDYIYKLWYDEGRESMSGEMLFRGNLNFSLDNPLETIVSYEANHIKKVYWTDGRNQPRLINIEADSQKVEKWNSEAEGICTFFDFVPSVKADNSIQITKKDDAGGLFAPGVIQYAYTYINKYGQQTNIIGVSPLQYLITGERGANSEEKVGSSFHITITKQDLNFDYIRLYSIQRTSLNAVPIVKLLDDIPVEDLESGKVIPPTYVDNGTTGSTIDPTELLYVGGREITALTMTDKDNTLFLGNITQKNTLTTAIQDYFDEIRGTENAVDIEFGNSNDKTDSTYATGIYPFHNSLHKSAKEVTTFKGGETYRFGFQLQKKTGDWSDPIFIDDKKNEIYPQTTLGSTSSYKLVNASAILDISAFANKVSNFYDVYQKIRPVVVYPSIGDRTVLCQGVVNPTVFNAQDRISNSPFAQASWFFRPIMIYGMDGGSEVEPSQTTNVTIPIPDNADYSVDSNFDDEDKLHSVCPVCLIQNEYNANSVRNILARKYLEFSVSYGSSGGIYRWSFNSYIKTTYDNKTMYVLFSEQQAYGSDYDFASFKMYKGLHTTGDGELYYMKADNDAPNSYTFKFYNMKSYLVLDIPEQGRYDSIINATQLRNIYMTITFNAVGTEGGSDQNIKVDGSAVSYLHYSNLIAQHDTEYSYQNRNVFKQVEVQGSWNKYPNAFSSGDPGISSNTQFLVDQSIVTLNSPDIEFDTEVQNSAVSGLKMRVIGLIPITANVSAHITNATASLPKRYNNGNSEGFGVREVSYNVMYENLGDADSGAGKRLNAEYFWNDVCVWNDEGTIKTGSKDYYYLIHPWHRTDALTNDPRGNDANAHLNSKKESNLLFSMMTEYLAKNEFVNFPKLDAQIDLTENEQVHNIRLNKQQDTSSSINYYPNIDKVLTNESGYTPLTFTGTDYEGSQSNFTSPINMKYKSTSHAVIGLQACTEYNNKIPILPYIERGMWSNPNKYGNDSEGTTFWNDTNMFFGQDSVSRTGYKYNFLWLAELYRDVDDSTRFGGKSKSALHFNQWIPGGDAVDLPTANANSHTVTLNWTQGDTYFQRYDCLKTYPFINEDPNQIIEILSFMCETHVNIDGRYDKNRGQTNNTYVNPQNFNLLNSVYSQQDNFFSSRKADTEDYTELAYPNQITWSKTKESGADVDLWTNVTLASALEMDGDKGSINKLTRLDDKILCFQDSGISQILYNENVQVSTESGVPIEIANSGKVQGKRYLSNSIGCSNKWSVLNTPMGIYFMDSNNKDIYRLGGQGLENISMTGGFNSWCKKHVPHSGIKWTPDNFENFVTYYDKQNQDVLFINENEALAYSEKFSCFTSFYDYGKAPYLCNLDDTGIWLHTDNTTNKWGLWKHQAGAYGRFFGADKPYWMTLVGNPEPQMDKIFTNLEFRACTDMDNPGDINLKPFDYIESWDEYQHGYANLDIRNGHTVFKHHTSDGNAHLAKKFRIWRCDIPRDNYEFLSYPEQEEGETAEHYQNRVNEYKEWLQSEHDKGIFRTGKHPMDRMRNPWLYIKLYKSEAGYRTNLKRTEIHDVVMTYFT